MLTTAQVERAGRADAEVQWPAHRHQPPFVDAMLPDGHRLHVVLDGISRGFSAVNIRKFVLRAATLHDLVELGTLSAPAAAFLDASVRAGLNILVAGGTQAGKTTTLNCLAAAIPGGERVVSAEEVFELTLPAPRLGSAPDPAGGAGGHRRDPAARPGQGEPPDAAEPPDRRRGQGGGVPGPAARAQLRAARHVHPARQQRARGAGEDVHPPAAGRENIGAGSSCRRWRRRSTSWSTSGSTRTACGGSTRSWRSRAGSRTT